MAEKITWHTTIKGNRIHRIGVSAEVYKDDFGGYVGDRYYPQVAYVCDITAVWMIGKDGRCRGIDLPDRFYEDIECEICESYA